MAKAPLGHKIDQYLNGRGSPMAGQGATFVRAGKRYGIDPRLLVGIATIESGAGEHMKLQYNPFNWGVHRNQTYSSYQEAIMDVARGLKRGYYDEGLKTPRAIVSKYAPASDNNDEGNWASVVGQVMGQLGGPPVKGGVPGAPKTSATTVASTIAPVPGVPIPATPVSTTPVFNPEMFRQAFSERILSGNYLKGSDLGALIGSSFAVPPPPAAPVAATPAANLPPGAAGPTGATNVKGQPIKYVGKKMVLPTEWKSTHPTSGLEDEGFTHAEDIMGKPGTPVGAPEDGVIVRHGSAQGGSSIYFRAKSGRMYWIGHIESNVPVGTKVKRGQTIAAISSDHAAPHVHLDYSTSYKG